MNRLAPLVALLTIACFDPNLHRETYEDGKMARNFGAYDRGIVPAFVPDGVRNVTTANDEKTGEVWVRCELPGDTLTTVSTAVPHAAMESVKWRQPPSFLGQWKALVTPPSTGFIYRQGTREWHGWIDARERVLFAYCLPK